MFAFHETTQRRICRVTFLVACVLPVVVTVAVVAYWNRPWRERDWQRTLAQQLHVRATLEEISSPRPGKSRLINLRLADLRSNHELAAFGKLAIETIGVRRTLSANRLEIQADQLPKLATVFATWLATDERKSFDFHADELDILNQAGQVVRLNDVTIRDDASGTGQQFRLHANDAAGKTLQVDIQSDSGTIHFALDAQQAGLPAWLIGYLVPGVRGCGNAIFHGSVAATYDGQRNHGTLTGTLADVDLQAWTGDCGPKRLQGIAQVEMTQLGWINQRISTAGGTILAQGGAVTESSLAAACKHFACVPSPGWEMLRSRQYSTELVPFEKLALSFQMSSAGIAFSGRCSEEAIIVADGRAMLFGPREKGAYSTANLVNLFHQPQRAWLPDTRAALNMGRELPLPGDASEDVPTLRK